MSTPEQRPENPNSAAAANGPTEPVDPTTRIPMQHTMPFRVEPDHPVPDDAVPGDPAPVTQPRSSAPMVTLARGPHLGTLVLGVFWLLIAVAIFGLNARELDVDLQASVPIVIASVGGGLLLIGGLGLLIRKK